MNPKLQLLLVTLMSAGLTGLTLQLFPPGGAEAQAQHPTLVQQAAEYLAGLRTAHKQGKGLRVRIDFEAPAVVVHISSGGRFHWDGTTARWATSPAVQTPSEVIDLPANRSQWLSDVWQELRAGFPNTTFYPGETPAGLDPHFKLARGANWYRVALPFTWAQDLQVFVNIGGNGRPGSLSIFDADGEPFQYRGFTTSRMSLGFAKTDVPLAPDVYSPEMSTFPPAIRSEHYRAPWNPRPYFQAITRLVLEYDEVVSNGRTASDGQPMQGFAWRYQACPEAPKVHRLPGSLVWRFPEDPAELQRVRDALLACPAVTFRMTMKGSHYARPGQRTCTVGDLSVLDTSTDPPTVRWTRHLAECRDGPAKETLPYLAEWTLDPDADPSTTEVRFDGAVEIHCQKITEEEASVELQMEWDDQPTFSWNGCYPGWDR